MDVSPKTADPPTDSLPAKASPAEERSPPETSRVSDTEIDRLVNKPAIDTSEPKIPTPPTDRALPSSMAPPIEAPPMRSALPTENSPKTMQSPATERPDPKEAEALTERLEDK